MEEKNKIIEVKHLSKKYGKSPKYAINDINFISYKGEILGLLGRNGAGKSTTIKCITGYLPFDEGSIQINGYDIKKNPLEAKMNFGYVSDNRATFEKMTGMEFLNFMSDIYKVPEDLRMQRIDEFQRSFELGESIYNLISSYSHGMKQKIAIMGSLVHFPEVWILDEPMTGLDPLITQSLRNYMNDYRKSGKTVLFSSHNLDAVQKICDRVLIIDNGKLVEEININLFNQEQKKNSLEEFFLDKYGV
jgi:ABC-2 type transport system ATP-binding protein